MYSTNNILELQLENFEILEIRKSISTYSMKYYL